MRRDVWGAGCLQLGRLFRCRGEEEGEIQEGRVDGHVIY